MGIEWIDNPNIIRKWLAKEELVELRKEWNAHRERKAILEAVLIRRLGKDWAASIQRDADKTHREAK